MVVSIEDGLGWIVDGQVLRSSLSVNEVTGTTVDGEVGGLVDKRSGHGISAGVGSVPEGTTEIDRPELVGIWLRDLLASDQKTILRSKTYTHRRRRRC